MTSKGIEGGAPIKLRSGTRVGVAVGPVVGVEVGVNVGVEVGSGVNVKVGVAVGSKRKDLSEPQPSVPDPRISKSINKKVGRDNRREGAGMVPPRGCFRLYRK
jgi:hypothetical protein